MEKEYVTWDDVNQFVDMVDYQTCRKVSGVYGLPRGGLILAVMLSHRLNVPLLMSPADNCMIVDDICDSGESLLHYVNNSSGHEDHKYTIVTMYYKEGAAVQPDMYSCKKDDKWIVFPWECTKP